MPRPSATVVLARDAANGPELLFIRRRAGDAFGDAYTFPGGVLVADESDARPYCRGLTDADASALLGIDAGGLDYYSAVVRELYEETGLFLGATGPVDTGYRAQLYGGTLSWSRFLGQQRLTIPCDALLYFTHWITPTGLPKRWSTRFFLAAAPAGQQVVPDGHEVTDHCWLSVGEALASARCGDRKLPYPTRRTVAAMAGQASVDQLVAWARQRQAAGVRTIQPEILTEDGKQRIFMPEIGD